MAHRFSFPLPPPEHIQVQELWQQGAAFSVYDMDEAAMLQWVETNPGRINERNFCGYTPVCTAVRFLKSLSLVLWLVKEKSADVNAANADGDTPLHFARSLDLLNALLACGTVPTSQDLNGISPLMKHCLALYSPDLVARLLQDTRVKATVNTQEYRKAYTALHFACMGLSRHGQRNAPPVIQLLLQAGADLTLTNADGQTPLSVLREEHPNHPTTLALLEQNADAEKASFLVKARRLVMAATRTAAPSSLQGRVARGQPLLSVALAPVTDGENNDEDEKARRKLRTTLAFLVGMEAGGMPRDVFLVVLDLVMPFWDPLRRKGPRQGGGR